MSDKAWGVVYVLGGIGMLDMAAQAFTDGEVRVIHSVLTAIFGPQA